MHNSYPEAELINGGESFEGRSILGLKIVTDSDGEEEKPKPAIIIESGKDFFYNLRVVH